MRSPFKEIMTDRPMDQPTDGQGGSQGSYTFNKDHYDHQGGTMNNIGFEKKY